MATALSTVKPQDEGTDPDLVLPDDGVRAKIGRLADVEALVSAYLRPISSATTIEKGNTVSNHTSHFHIGYSAAPFVLVVIALVTMVLHG